MTVCLEQTTHVTNERHRERNTDCTTEAGYRRSITIYRVQSACSQTGSLSLSPFTLPRNLRAPVPCCSLHLCCSSYTRFQPAATSFIPAVSASSLVSQPTSLLCLTGPNHSTPTLALMAYEQSIFFHIKIKEKEMLIQIQTSVIT